MHNCPFLFFSFFGGRGRENFSLLKEIKKKKFEEREVEVDMGGEEERERKINKEKKGEKNIF